MACMLVQLHPVCPGDFCTSRDYVVRDEPRARASVGSFSIAGHVAHLPVETISLQASAYPCYLCRTTVTGAFHLMALWFAK